MLKRVRIEFVAQELGKTFLQRYKRAVQKTCKGPPTLLQYISEFNSRSPEITEELQNLHINLFYGNKFNCCRKAFLSLGRQPPLRVNLTLG